MPHFEPPDRKLTKDELFLRVIAGIFLLVFLYGVVMAAVIFWGDEKIARVMLSAFGVMFTAIIGFGTGYLVGKNGKNNGQ